MYDKDYKYPRTIKEAFGPGAFLTVEKKSMDNQDKIVLSVCCIALVFVGFVFSVWG